MTITTSPVEAGGHWETVLPNDADGVPSAPCLPSEVAYAGLLRHVGGGNCACFKNREDIWLPAATLCRRGLRRIAQYRDAIDREAVTA